jgi:hypothetical protein
MRVVKSLAAFAIGCSMLAQDRVNPDAAIVDKFEKRVAEYVNFQRKLAKGIAVKKPTKDPQEILDRQHELARKIREERRHEHQGAIFTPEIAKEFHRLLAIAMQGRNDTDIKKSLERAEPVSLKLNVNDAYPADIPLQSTPPTILANLPRLPPEVEYRIAGHALVLRDVEANVVIDLIPDAVP